MAQDESTYGGLRTSRRTLLGYLVAAPTLSVAVSLGLEEPAAAKIPTPGGVADVLDLSDAQLLAVAPTANLISLDLREDGTVHFALPRMEVGQGITTSTAMIIADELDISLDKIKVTLADARPELLMNQLTGGSNTTMTTYLPIRTAAAIARRRLLDAAATKLGGDVPLAALRTVEGRVLAPSGIELSYGELAAAASVGETVKVEAKLKEPSEFTVIGTPRNRIDALEAVTGRKQFTTDMMDVDGALPTMVCRPPTLNGKVGSVNNRAAVLDMPGVTHVAKIPTGVAVRAETFGQCIDAVRALDVSWGPGPVDGLSDADILKKVRRAELPLAVPKVPLLAKTVETTSTFWFRSNSALETNCAIADVRPGRATVWGGFKAPIVAQERMAEILGLPPTSVTVHCVTGGGSFGRKVFPDAAIEAVQASKAMGVPVKLMWHRADDSRQGRVHPMATTRIRATVLAGEVLTWELRHTGVKNDFTHGFGDVLTATAPRLPVADLGFSETVFALTQGYHYDFGVSTQLLNEIDLGFTTGAMRNIYSPDVATAREVTVDKLAAAVGKDPYRFRQDFVREERSKAVLEKVAKQGNWGRAMPPGTAQGIAINNEYHSFSACLVEIDCRPETVNRKVREGVTGPRVTKVVIGVDAGLVVNPRGLDAQMMSGAMDGIAQTLTSSLHLRDGYFLEASWDNYAYTREWNTPPTVEVIIVPNDSEDPGGAGELAVAASMAATANAYARATGKTPTEYPINHHDPSHFEVKPTIPPVPQSPTDGLTYVQE